MLYKIGDFSKKVNHSIRTLRYYDEIDLFKPSEVDLYTGYRYYSDEQLEEIKIIDELKDVGFTLDEIKRYWNNLNDSIMLEKKQELIDSINVVNEKIKKVDYLRSNISNGKIRFSKTEQVEVKKKSLL